MNREWWKEAAVYQIYPKSFNDSNGDGIGDIPGIIEKVDYLDRLDIDVVWLNPVYDSPQADNGYDIRNYRKIHSDFGTMEDWEELRDKLHERGIKLIMDLVVNHTSSEHEWFQKSRRSEEKYKDYYIWRDGEPENPPNNWTSFFGGPAWSYDEKREAWYLHLFDPKQPDLNWKNPKVREEVKDLMHFWLEKGIDGFRMDVINAISKTEGFPDGDPETDGPTGKEHFMNGPKAHKYLREIREDVIDDYNAVTVGEMPFLTPEEALKYTKPERDELDMIFHFEHMYLDKSDPWWDIKDWNLSDLKEVFTKWQKGLEDGGWEGLYWSNHDQPRVVSRFGSKKYPKKSAKMLGTMLYTLRGTTYTYQGEELGMINFPFEKKEQLRDVNFIRKIEIAQENGQSFENVLEGVRYYARDNSRTPMQWNEEENAGFTSGEPWIQVNPNYRKINAENQIKYENSVFNYYRKLIQARKENPVLVYGSYEILHKDDPQLYIYRRELGNEEALVILNFSELKQDIELDGLEEKELLISNYPDETDVIRPYGARVYITT